MDKTLFCSWIECGIVVLFSLLYSIVWVKWVSEWVSVCVQLFYSVSVLPNLLPSLIPSFFISPSPSLPPSLSPSLPSLPNPPPFYLQALGTVAHLTETKAQEQFIELVRNSATFGLSMHTITVSNDYIIMTSY